MLPWKKLNVSWAQRWDLSALILILAILLTGIFAKLNEGWWAILTVVALCLLLAAPRRGRR